jgi:hypothetical protein
VVKRNLEIITFLEEHKSRGKSEGDWTYFDISPFYTSCYQIFQLSGETLNLPQKIAMPLGETYELIFTHNSQIALLTLELPPRTRGISKSALVRPIKIGPCNATISQIVCPSQEVLHTKINAALKSKPLFRTSHKGETLLGW